jgi:hypothetical protein
MPAAHFLVKFLDGHSTVSKVDFGEVFEGPGGYNGRYIAQGGD